MKDKTPVTYPRPGDALQSLHPADFARRFLPRYCRHAFNPMHHFVFDEYLRQSAGALTTREGRRLAIAAPRGSAKSTVLTLVLPLMDILLQRERHIVIVSATEGQAVGKLANIVFELMNNERVRDAFFGGNLPDLQKNRRKLDINGIRVEAYSAGGEMRGLLHGEFRPTRIILDDVESSNGSLKSHGRKKLQTWYDEVIENLGDTYTHITIAGTVLHYNSLLSKLLERPGFVAQNYRSVIKWSERGDLWQHWQRLYADRTDPHAIETAKDFYLENKPEMDRGVQVLWPEKEDYYHLQKQLVSIGRAAFFKKNLIKYSRVVLVVERGVCGWPKRFLTSDFLRGSRRKVTLSDVRKRWREHGVLSAEFLCPLSITGI